MSKKILVIDDEPDVVIFLTALLKKHGYETISAEDGKQAFQLLKQEKPDLVTLDLAMPNQTGTDFYRKMAKDKELSETPVIVHRNRKPVPLRFCLTPHPGSTAAWSNEYPRQLWAARHSQAGSPPRPPSASAPRCAWRGTKGSPSPDGPTGS